MSKPANTTSYHSGSRPVSYPIPKTGPLASLETSYVNGPGQIEQNQTYQLITRQALAYAQDLKQAIRRERQSQQALNRLRQTFLSTVNHELRTPLALAFQGLELLEDPRLGSLTEGQLDALTVIRRQTHALNRMIDGLIRVAAFLSKQEAIKLTRARLEPVFADTLPLAEFKARSKEISFETDIASDLPVLSLDVKQMTEALMQLLDNAIKFNQPGGQIKVSAQADDYWVVLKVSDSGIGMEPDQVETLWEIFEQGVDPIRRAQEGLGLGLVLARYIVKAHSGLIEVETTPGCGSTFTVRLPRA